MKKVGKLVGVCNCICHCGLDNNCITEHDKECIHCKPENLPCGCPKTDENSMCINQSHMSKPGTNGSEEIVNDILEKSKGHQVTYQSGEEDGTLRDDKAIPLGWFKQWLKIGIAKERERILQGNREIVEKGLIKMFEGTTAVNGGVNVSSHNIQFYGNEMLEALR